MTFIPHSGPFVQRFPAKRGRFCAPWKYLAIYSKGLIINTVNLLASFMNLAGPDLIVILLIILVLFGAKKLPELARGMGQAVKEFQKAKDEFSDELNKAGTDANKTAEVKPAASTLPRNTDSSPTVAKPNPQQNNPPGDQAGQV